MSPGARAQSGLLGAALVALALGALQLPAARPVHGLAPAPADQASSKSQDAQGERPGAGLAGYLLARAPDQLAPGDRALDAALEAMLNRVGPDTRVMRDFADAHTTTVEVARRAWQLMHHHARAAASDRVNFVRPLLVELLRDANASAACVAATQATLDAAKELRSWAIQLFMAWGSFPPTGLFEGTYGDIGSYHGCVNVPQNEAIKHAHYCTLSYRPVLPRRHEFEIIVKKEPLELRQLFDGGASSLGASRARANGTTARANQERDAFSDLLDYAQYSHYIYWKLGACFPIDCSPLDVQRAARLLGRRSYLVSGPVKCASKFAHDYERARDASQRALSVTTRDAHEGLYIWKPAMNRTQWVALAILASLTGLILLLSLADVLCNRLPACCAPAARNTKAGRAYPVEGGEQKEAAVRMLEDTALELDDAMAAATNGHSRVLQLQLATLSAGEPAPARKANGLAVQPVDQAHEKPANGVDIEWSNNNGNNIDNHNNNKQLKTAQAAPAPASKRAVQQRSLWWQLVDDYSIVTNVKQFFTVSQHQLSNDILCINGIRCITMSWIVVTHTMQYNDWSAFARTREIETHLKSLISQPLFNGTYLVDSFFLISGLLTSFSLFHANQGVQQRATATTKTPIHSLAQKFSIRAYLVGRYLRLTPQIMFVSLLFILLPQMSRTGGPHWYTITGEYSENCVRNWWISLLHIQAFYRTEETCNYVCWWISVDMFYHLFALAIIMLILFGRRHLAALERVSHQRLALVSCSCLALAHGLLQVYKHVELALPPNLLSTIPQMGAMWSKMTLEYFWTPFAHAFPFFLGFYIGYLMSRCAPQIRAWFTPRRALAGWTCAVALLVLQLYSTYNWIVGEWRYTRAISSLFNVTSAIIWSACLTWIIVACHSGFGGWINSMLSCRPFLVLGKASFVVYLSHFLVLFTFYGNQNLLLEPTQLMMFYIILGNICLSMIFGSFLCVVFEMPWLKTQKRIMRWIS